MATIPKKLAFKLYFRRKTKTRKLIGRERKLRQLSKNTNTIVLAPFSYKSILKPPDFKPCFQKLSKQRSFDNDDIINPNLPSIYGGENNLNFLKRPLLLSQRQKSNDTQLNNIFYPKQKSNIWLISTNDVYFVSQTHCSVSSQKLIFGLYGICAVQYATISAAYIETIKLDIAKILKKKGRVWTRVCCDCPVSARPAETRMGKGKGSISHWVAKVRPGQLLFEFSGITKTQLDEIFQKLCKKTSIGLSIVS
uniref:Ribosomal protein L16 n=1 Tax=Ulva lacinulata TaxID=2806530 RepID=A0A7L9R4P6_9CHLO|nr:ribosomal protein L16 [Ulva lacinulata]QOL10355.1 ribosomal protein L16 [Ulva lacinulata]ULC80564.1 ribosomal protein L16 [Ulva rigida]